ncbi:polysaccharide deacetylase family protein [Kribbella sp. CA-293567]|uniref:polysaccharide deacetylase family protein n=1 Tax=Kribbella sp. CA-293567 TaxID=3002436 RepID=UPI0022DE72AD|nr:polysaccharide deacetylase family protein [Kribbella sp. CA-293567]WBQ06041.1 polysaccharide deacetylase family protein [Kribbella sp. CA-293567]
MTVHWGIRLAAVAAAAGVVLAGCGDTAAPPETAAGTPIVSAPVTPTSTTPSPTRGPSKTPRPGESHETNLMPIVQHGPRGKKRVALTFDADLTAVMRKRLLHGKVKSYYNEQLISTLRKERVPATLFLTGMWMEQYPDRTRELAADPLFELGTHTYAHKAFTKHCYTLGTIARADMLTDVRRAVVLLDQLDAHATRWFRFPGGCYDGTALHELAPAGVTAVGLDVPGADGFAKSPRPIVQQVLGNVQNGSIVVLHLHGGDNAPYTAEAITPIITGLRERGFEFVTVTELMKD